MRFILIILLTCSINAFKINDIQFKTINKDNIIHSDSLFEIIVNVSEPLSKQKSTLFLYWENEKQTMPFKYSSYSNGRPILVYSYLISEQMIYKCRARVAISTDCNPFINTVCMDGQNII